MFMNLFITFKQYCRMLCYPLQFDSLLHVFFVVLVVQPIQCYYEICPQESSMCYFSFPELDIKMWCLEGAQGLCGSVIPGSFPIELTEKVSKRILLKHIEYYNASRVILNAIKIESQAWVWQNSNKAFEDNPPAFKECSDYNLVRNQQDYETDCTPTNTFHVICALSCPQPWEMLEEKRGSYYDYHKFIYFEMCEKQCIENIKCRAFFFSREAIKENIKGMCYLSNEANKERFESDEEFTLYLRSNKTNCLQGRIVPFKNISFNYQCHTAGKNILPITIICNLTFLLLFAVILTNIYIVHEKLDVTEDETSDSLFINEEPRRRHVSFA